jgi:glutamate--cysteine ligase
MADYALAAPLMMVRRGDDCVPVTDRIPLRAWLADQRRIGWAAAVADVDHHLTTLFPPVRTRGYVELRALDALPDRWWPGVVAFVVTLVDDPVAADRAREVCERLTGLAEDAARVGLAHPVVRAVLAELLQVALGRCPAAVLPDLEVFAALLDQGRTPSDELRARIERSGPIRVLEEEAHA